MIITTIKNKNIRTTQGIDVNRFASIQDALDSGEPNIFFPRKDYFIDATLTLPSFTNVIGELGARIIARTIDVGIMTLTSSGNNVIKNLTFTHKSKLEDADVGVAYGVDFGTGPGCGACPDVLIQNCTFADIPNQAVRAFGGTLRWNIDSCRFYRCGRAFVVMNGAKECQVINCYGDSSGDDLIAFNNNSYGCSAVGNTFLNGGNQNGQLGGIRVTGEGASIIGNVIVNCLRGITLEADSVHEGFGNNVTAADMSTISNNVILGLDDANDSNPSYESIGIRVTNANNVLVSGNMVQANRPSGQAVTPLQLGRCNNVQFSNNSWEGGPCTIVSHARNVRFYGDRFASIRAGVQNSSDDFEAVRVISGRNVAKVEFKDCRIQSGNGHFLKVFSESKIGRLDIDSFQDMDPVPVGYLAEDLTNGVQITSIEISDGNNDNADSAVLCPRLVGLRYAFKDGVELALVSIDNTGGLTSIEHIVLDGDYSMGSTTLNIQPFTPTKDYTDGNTYIGFVRPTAQSGTKSLVHGLTNSVVEDLRVWNKRDTSYTDISGSLSVTQFSEDGSVGLPSI